jgi:glycosyltransferase involved in cell wall biosynthesis
MTATNPYFTIVIPTFNRASLIKKTLESILEQSFSDYEVIVVDDGGNDHTEDVVRAMSSAKIIYYKKANGERGAARNYGIKKALGKYITFLDSDDIFYFNHLETAYQFLTVHPNIVCYAQAYEVKEVQTNNILSKAYISSSELINEQIISGNFLSCFGVFVKRETFSAIRFEEDRRFAGTEDWLLWLQLAARFPFYFNNMVTGAMLEHDNRSVLSFNEKSLTYRTETLKEKLLRDPIFIKRFGANAVNKIYAHMLSYTSLHLAMSRQKKRALRYLLKAGLSNVGEWFTRRSLAITKKLIFS